MCGMMKAVLRGQGPCRFGERLTVLERRLRVRQRSALKFTAHTNRRSEPGLRGVDSIEADPLIEPLGGTGRHL